MPEPSLVSGIALAALGGVFNGIFALPMKFMRRWKWEHTWLIYSVVAMVAFPWAVALLSTPHLGQLISEAPLGLICGFGFAWGVGAVLFGLGIVRLGIGLGLALIMGTVTGIGSLVPMVVLHPGALGSRAGRFILLGNAITIVGIALCAYAGHLRERYQAGAAEGQSGRRSLPISLLIAIMSGVFSAMLNFSFAFSSTIQKRAVELGAAPAMASMGVWALAVSAGFLANAAYCMWLIGRGGWAAFKLPQTGLYWLGAVVMGLFWFGSIIAYGIGGTKLGSAGPVVGWPVVMGSTVVMSNIVGWLIGEWRGTGWSCRACLGAGITAIVAATIVIAQGSAM